MTEAGPLRVAASEHLLIALARGLVGGPAQHAALQPILAGRTSLPPRIGPTAAGLVQDALRQSWTALALRGQRRFWRHHAPVELAFSSATLAVLRWLVATPLASEAAPTLPVYRLTIGDQVVIYLALAAAPRPSLAAQPLVRAAPLAWLGFADLLARDGHTVPDFASLTAGAGAIVVEALTPELGARWAAVERVKASLTSPAAVVALGAAQDATLGGFMRAVGPRRDLAAFVLEAAAASHLSPEPRGLDPGASLAARGEARLAAGALLRAVAHWTAWDHEHRGVRFFDEGYDQAQALLARFERLGLAHAARAAEWLADLAALPGHATLGSAS